MCKIKTKMRCDGCNREYELKLCPQFNLDSNLLCAVCIYCENIIVLTTTCKEVY